MKRQKSDLPPPQTKKTAVLTPQVCESSLHPVTRINPGNKGTQSLTSEPGSLNLGPN